MAPVLNGDREPRDRRRPDSASTGQHSEKTERFELEESSEFLQSVDGEINVLLTSKKIVRMKKIKLKIFRSGQAHPEHPGRAGVSGPGGVTDEAPSPQLQHPLQLQQGALEAEDPQGNARLSLVNTPNTLL